MTDKVVENRGNSHTKGKTKEIIILKTPMSLYFAKFKDGGQLPAALGGVWTDYNELSGRISSYLAKKQAEKNKPRTRRRKSVDEDDSA